MTAIGLVLALASHSCGGSPPRSGKAPGSVRSKITFLHYFSDELSGGVDGMIRLFNEANPEYELGATALDHESFKTSIHATLGSATPPDLYSYWAGAKTEAVVENLLPLDEAWAKAGLDGVFPRILTESACEYGGKKYLLPITQHFVAFFYNKSVFSRLGLAEPRTWEEFLSACARIKAAGVSPIALGAKTKWPAQFWFDYLLLRTAGKGYRDGLIGGKASFTDPEVKRAFALWKRLLDSGYFHGDPNALDWAQDANELVYKGEAAMTLMGTWVMGSWTDPRHGWVPDRDFGAFAFPEVDRGVPVAALGPVDGVVIPLKALNPEGAKQVIAFLASKASQEAMSRGSGAFAPSVAADPSIYSPIQAKLRKAVDSADSWNYNFDLIFPPTVQEAGLDAFAEFLAFPDLADSLLADLEARAGKGR